MSLVGNIIVTGSVMFSPLYVTYGITFSYILLNGNKKYPINIESSPNITSVASVDSAGNPLLNSSSIS